MSQISLEIDPVEPISRSKIAFLEGLLATWLAIADGRDQPTAEQRRRGRFAAIAALEDLRSHV